MSKDVSQKKEMNLEETIAGRYDHGATLFSFGKFLEIFCMGDYK